MAAALYNQCNIDIIEFGNVSTLTAESSAKCENGGGGDIIREIEIDSLAVSPHALLNCAHKSFTTHRPQ